MAKRIPEVQILDVKRHLDNGFNGLQINEVLGVKVAIISRVRNGHYGELPTFKKDPALREKLCEMNKATLKTRVTGWITRRELKG